MDCGKYTPGPWKAVPMKQPIGAAKYAIQWSDAGELVADVVYEESDAVLMAAAPELLDALERSCRNALETGVCTDAFCEGCDCYKARKKARGEG